uniref:Uncharacterized protein n=1 Tax=Anguilla anguilla TaxID=7936 RepID=A0A0E9SBY0_ANGAN
MYVQQKVKPVEKNTRYTNYWLSVSNSNASAASLRSTYGMHFQESFSFDLLFIFYIIY